MSIFRVYLIFFPGLWHRVEKTITSITSNFSTKVCEEFDFKFDVCRITKDADIAHLKDKLN